MYLAVCDDNIADRKQTERLLGRQSDRIFKETGERIYIDSYGNVDAFLQTPEMYNGLFIDMVNGDFNGFEIVRMLLHQGIDKPIILCPSTLDYRSMVKEAGITAENVYFLDKPIKVSELTAIMDMIREVSSVVIPTLELRGRTETVYAKGDEIICARKNHSEVDVYLTGNRIISLITEIANFYDQCDTFPQICPVSESSIVNVNHIQKTSFMKVTLDNDMTIPVSLSHRNSIQKTRDYLKENNL